MNKLSQNAVQEFQEIWESEYGEILSDEEALKLALRTLKLIAIIYKPIKSNEYGATETVK